MREHDDLAPLLREVAERSAEYLAALGDRPVRASMRVAEVRAALQVPLPERSAPPAEVTRLLAGLGPSATTASAGPRYFGFVTGGSVPAATAAELLAVAWDQNAAMAVMSPLASVTEEIAGGWLLELLGLPAHASFGFVTGCQSANTTCLAVARHHVLAGAGWDVEARGLHGAPPVRVVAGAQRHATIDTSLRLLGLGAPTALAEADAQGRMRPESLAALLAGGEGPAIVCLQAGNVNTGAFDPFPELVAIAHRHGAWVHVDGAFGLWAAAAPARRHLTAGVARADSWATDGHKWLNVPYDCGYAFTAHADSHRATHGSSAGYYVLGGDDAPRDGMEWSPEASRRARGIATYAAIRSLGREGVADMVERCCAHAAALAEALGSEPGIEVCNDVVLNQVLLRFGDDDRTRAVTAAVQEEGTCWAGGTTWESRAAMRVSVSNWRTTADDITRSGQAIAGVHRGLGRCRGLPPQV